MAASMRISSVLTLATVVTPVLAQGVSWQQLMPAVRPPGRTMHAMAMDLARGEVVLFGGMYKDTRNYAVRLADTWTWNGSNWTQAQPGASPPARNGHTLAYDSARSRVVLFGGNGPPVGDTWEWDGSNWTQIATTGAPSARQNHYMTFDSIRQRVVLFGGLSGGTTLGDTWEFDGASATWTRVGVNQPPRQLGSMAFDPVRARVVRFGGVDRSFNRLGDTWEFDGASATWTRVFPSVSPVGRSYGEMTYDLDRQRVVMFGGNAAQPAGASLGDTWEWDGTTWVDVTPASGPPPRWSGVLVFNPVTRRSLLFGGSERDDTWARSSVTPASHSPYGAGCAGSAGVPTLASDGMSLPWLGDSFTVEFGNLPSSCRPFLLMGFSRANLPIPGVPGCSLLVAEPIVALGLTLNGSIAAWTGVVPNDPSLIGVMFHLQGAALLAGGGNSFGAVVSNALEATIGAR